MIKGQVMSEEQKQKIRESNLGKKHNISKEGRKRMSANFVKGGWNKGKTLSPEWKEKIRQANLGKHYGESTKEKHHKRMLGESNPRWVGEKVEYRGLHLWVERNLGKPKHCEHCGKNDPTKRYHWANKSHEYKYDLSDWLRLCVSCHKRYDFSS